MIHWGKKKSHNNLQYRYIDALLEMFLPKSKPDLLTRDRFRRILDVSGCSRWAAEVDAHVRPDARRVKARHIGMVKETVTHCSKESLEVGSAKVRTRLQLCQRIELHAHRVQVNIRRSVGVQSLREVYVDSEEFRPTHRCSGCSRLVFETGEEGLEPFKGRCVPADPDELHSP